MTFKKDGVDPEYNPAPFIGLRWVGEVAIRLGFTRDPSKVVNQPEDHLRYRRPRRPQQKRKARPNMLHVSKRVRRKHRRAA